MQEQESEVSEEKQPILVAENLRVGTLVTVGHVLIADCPDEQRGVQDVDWDKNASYGHCFLSGIVLACEAKHHC